MFPLVVKDAAGCRLRDIDGNEYIDLAGGYGPHILGYAHPAVVSAIGQAVASGAVNAVKDSPVVNKAEDYVSEAWETGSRYFHEHSFKDMADDVAGVIRRNPIPALLVGVGLGFILARSLRS